MTMKMRLHLSLFRGCCQYILGLTDKILDFAQKNDEGFLLVVIPLVDSVLEF